VLLAHVARLSGAEIGLARFVEASAGRLDAVVVLAEDGPLATTIRETGGRVEVLELAPEARLARRGDLRPGPAQARGAAHVAAYVPRLARRIGQLRPDLVHGISLKSGLYGSLAGRLARRPAIWHVHDYLTEENLSPRVAPVMRRAVATLPSGVVAPSQSTLDSVGPLPARLPRAVFPFPVPMPSRATELRPAVRTVGIVGRLTPWKGQHVFLRGFAAAFGDRPEVRARIIGSAVFGEQDYADGLAALVRELGIADRVEFRGFRSDVAGEMAELDVLVHASTLPDPLPGVVLEGLGVGVPIVASAAGGHAEHLRRAEAGLLVEAGDHAALGAALRRLADEPGLRATLAARGRELAREFAPDVLVDRALAFYDEVLRSRGRR
jgi:glycosyltransferase involved in cell wall biosynthesis